jgi:lysozyme
MRSNVPPAKPRITADAVEKIVRQHGVSDQVVLVGMRGYYLNSMGKRGVNDRGIYDDAIALLTPTAYATFNANTDPSIYSPGIATLLPGVHRYRKGRHGISRGAGYPALRPATKGEVLPVTRDGRAGTATGIALNIHSGGRNSTSSRGCQTIHPSQWPAFQSLVYEEMSRHKQTTVPYILTAA